MTRQRQDQAAAERVEDQAIGNGMHQAAGNRAETRERLEPVSGNGQRQRQRPTNAALAQAEKLLDIEVAWRRTVQLAELLRHRRADDALDQDVGTGTDRGERADDRLARRAANDLLRALQAIRTLRLGQP